MLSQRSAVCIRSAGSLYRQQKRLVPDLLSTKTATMKHLLSTKIYPRRFFPYSYTLEAVRENEQWCKWPRPFLILDFDNCPTVIEERLTSLMLTCRAAAIPLCVIASTKTEFSHLQRYQGLQLHERDTYDRIAKHVLSLDRSDGIELTLGEYYYYWANKQIDPNIMIVTTEEYDKDKLSSGSPPDIAIDILSSDTQLLCPFWRNALNIDRLLDLKQQTAMLSTTVLSSYLDHSNAVGTLYEMQQADKDKGQGNDDVTDLTFTELPYMARLFERICGGSEFCFECRISSKKQQLRSIGYGYNLKSAKQEAGYSMLAQLALEAYSSSVEKNDASSSL